MSEPMAHKHGFLGGLRQVIEHGAITLLAVALAFSLPEAASFILYDWWPRVETNSQMLLATEILLASVLALLFNLGVAAWYTRRHAASAKLASLVLARTPHPGRLAQFIARRIVRSFPAGRDACMLSLTGYDTLVAKESLLRESLAQAYEVRVMLLDPLGDALRRRVEQLPDEVTQASFLKEIRASIAFLNKLRRTGKKVSLRFYDRTPLWKIVILGDHAWVQHCHDGHEMKEQPEYVFALQQAEPRQGLFVPFYSCFLHEWSRAGDTDYDFDTNELVQRDAAGRETGRVALELPAHELSPHPQGRTA